MLVWPCRVCLCLFAAVVLGGRPPAALRADDPPERKTVVVDAAVLDTYVGRYQLLPGVEISLRRHRQRLIAKVTGQPPFEVHAESETRFFWKVVDARLTIEKDKDGKVTGFLFEQAGRKLKAKKVSGELPEDAPVAEPPPAFDSPRLAALAKAVKGGDGAAVGRFWEEVRDRGPLVEPISGDDRHSWVSYVWRGTDRTRRVFLRGGTASANDHKPLERLADTDVWYLTERVPNDARLTYLFHVNAPQKVPDDPPGHVKFMDRFPPQPDPHNPRSFWMFSVLELPAAPKQPWVERLPGVAKGRLKEHKLQSEGLKQERSFVVYTPPGYDPDGERCGLLVLFDGPDYRDADQIPGPVILDNLIARKKLRPLVAVFVKPIDRNKELGCSEPFADFLAKELVPWVRKNYRVSDEPGRTIVGGLSLGGVMASYCGLRHPEVFGNVLSQSGSYHWSPGWLEGTAAPGTEPGWLTRQFVEAPRRAVRFYLQAGRFEDGFPLSLLAENRRFRDVLRAKGYPVRYAEFNGGHAHVNWRGSFADGLIELAGPPDQK